MWCSVDHIHITADSTVHAFVAVVVSDEVMPEPVVSLSREQSVGKYVNTHRTVHNNDSLPIHSFVHLFTHSFIHLFIMVALHSTSCKVRMHPTSKLTTRWIPADVQKEILIYFSPMWNGASHLPRVRTNSHGGHNHGECLDILYQSHSRRQIVHFWWHLNRRL